MAGDTVRKDRTGLGRAGQGSLVFSRGMRALALYLSYVRRPPGQRGGQFQADHLPGAKITKTRSFSGAT